jgi:hypothetical protein
LFALRVEADPELELERWLSAGPAPAAEEEEVVEELESVLDRRP